MRFIHTADWQIGMRAVHAGDAAKRVREARLGTASRVCDLAAAESADFLLLAGDTFEDNTVDRDLVARVADLLDRAACPVYVLPGNHDPIQPGCVWDEPVWMAARNVTVLRENRPVALPGGTLLPCPLRARRSPDDPSAWIGPASGPGIRVVVAHGNAGEIMADDGGFPISMDTPARTAADFVALGHWHSTLIPGPRMAYSGTPEPTRFGEASSGNVLLVSIDEPGSKPLVSIRKTGQLRWLQIGSGEMLTSRGSLAEVVRRLEATPEPQNTLVEVILQGLLFESDQDQLVRIDRAAAGYLHARIDRAGLRAAPDDHGWIEHLPAGTARAAADRLRAMAAG